MRADVARDWKWADRFKPEIFEILKANALLLVTVREATDFEDLKEATDMVLEVEGGTVAVRVRRPNCKWRDLTIRSWRLNGIRTEEQKIIEGFGRWYLYAWASNNEGALSDWMLVDLDVLRKSDLLEGCTVRVNPDGRSGFKHIDWLMLYREGCIVSCTMLPQQENRSAWYVNGN